MPKGKLSVEAEGVAKRADSFKTLEELPLVTTGCDSYASWHPKFKHLSPVVPVEQLALDLTNLCPDSAWVQPNGNDVHLVITGGEPLLGWQRSYPALLSQPCMDSLRNITFETNGTQALDEDLADFFENWTYDVTRQGRGVTFSVSPKLSVSGEKWEAAIRPEVVVGYQEVGTVYLKFVVVTPEDFDEVDKAVDEYRANGFDGSVFVMPVGGVEQVYDRNQGTVAELALHRGYYYSPRLHLTLFGNAWGT